MNTPKKITITITSPVEKETRAILEKILEEAGIEYKVAEGVKDFLEMLGPIPGGPFWSSNECLNLMVQGAKSSPHVIMRHWTEGGTAVTNFDPDQAPIFEEAIKEYGDDNLIIFSKGIPAYGSDTIIEWLYSLHYLKRENRKGDLSEFWKVYRRVEESHVKPEPPESE